MQEKLTMRKLIPILALLACLFWPTKAEAILTPVTQLIWSGGVSNTHSAGSITVSANQIVIVESFMVSSTLTAMVCTSVPALTWSTDSFAIRSDSAVGEGIGSALTGSTSGTVTVTCVFTGSVGSNFNDIYLATFPSTTESVDSECHTHGTIGASPLTGCQVTTHFTNDMIISLVLIDKVLTSSTYDTLAIVTGTFAGEWAAWGITAGAPGNSTATYTFTGGSITVAGVNTVAYDLSTSTSGSVRHRSSLTNYHPPERFTPQLLYTILRNWIKEAYEGRA
jgi:hypothetical protein